MPSPSAILCSDQISHRSGKAFRDGQVEDAIGLPAHDHRPRQQLGRLLAAHCQGIEKSRQDFRLYGLQMPERITIFRFQAASGGTFQNIVHDRRALCGNRAAAVRRKQVTFSPQSADRQPGRSTWFRYRVPHRVAQVSRPASPRPGEGSEPKRGPIGSTNSLLPSGWADRTAMHDRDVTANVSIPSVGDLSGRRIYIEDIYPRRRCRPFSGQAHCRRDGGGLGRHLSGRSCRPCRRVVVAAGSREQMVSRSDACAARTTAGLQALRRRSPADTFTPSKPGPTSSRLGGVTLLRNERPGWTWRSRSPRAAIS